jgi:outer membrane protein
MSGKAKPALRALLPLLLLAAVPVAAQQPAARPLKIAVIDSDRVVAESTRGKAALATLQTLQEQKVGEGRRLQQEIVDLRKRMEDGRLSLAPDKLEELRKQIQDKGIALERFQADAQRQLEEERERSLSGIEKDIIAIIDALGREQGYTLIFNKFRSGLVFAEEGTDITATVIQRFDAARPAGQ